MHNVWWVFDSDTRSGGNLCTISQVQSPLNRRRSFRPLYHGYGAWLRPVERHLAGAPAAPRVCAAVVVDALQPCRLLARAGGLRRGRRWPCIATPAHVGAAGSAIGVTAKAGSARYSFCGPAGHAAGHCLDQQHAFLLHKAAYRFVSNNEQVVRDQLDVFVSVPAKTSQPTTWPSVRGVR